MARPVIRTAEELAKLLRDNPINKKPVVRVIREPHFHTAVLAVKAENADALVDQVLRKDPMPPSLTKGVQDAAQRARFK